MLSATLPVLDNEEEGINDIMNTSEIFTEYLCAIHSGKHVSEITWYLHNNPE